MRHWLNQSTVELNGSQGLDSSRSDCMQSSTIISRRRPPSFLPCRLIFFHTCFALAGPCRSNPKDVLKWKSSVTARKSDVTQKENSEILATSSILPFHPFSFLKVGFFFLSKRIKKKPRANKRWLRRHPRSRKRRRIPPFLIFFSPSFFSSYFPILFLFFSFLSYRRVI